MDQDHQDRIRQRAHDIWESEGRPEGRDSDHWSRAEEELRNQMGNDSASGDGAQSDENAQADQSQPAVADAMASETAKKPRKMAAKTPKGTMSESTSHLNDGL